MERILIIKLGALGDVVRTLPIAEALKKKNPKSEITWITKKDTISLFEGNPFIDKVFSIPFHTQEQFQKLYNFDIEPEAMRLAGEIKAERKCGFYTEDDYPQSYNVTGEYYLNTLFDDETKKTNVKTYQEMMFAVAELPYQQEQPHLYLNEEEQQYGEAFLKEKKIKREKLLGVHMGASSRWPSKVWHQERLSAFIKKAKKRGYEILLFAGPNEEKDHALLIKSLEKKGINIQRNNPRNSMREFAALVNICRTMICLDSFALEIALALEKPTVGLFFCTPPHEIEGYRLLKKITSPLLKEFFPERMDQYDPELTRSISEDEVLAAVEEIERNGADNS